MRVVLIIVEIEIVALTDRHVCFASCDMVFDGTSRCICNGLKDARFFQVVDDDSAIVDVFRREHELLYMRHSCISFRVHVQPVITACERTAPKMRFATVLGLIALACFASASANATDSNIQALQVDSLFATPNVPDLPDAPSP